MPRRLLSFRWMMFLPCVLLVPSLQAQTGDAPLTAEQMMQQVAANQDRAESERAQFVYLQHADVQSRKGKQLMCQEITETRIAPLPKGESRTLLSLAGQVRTDHRTIRYNKPPWEPTHAGAGQVTQSKDNEDKHTVHDQDSGLDVRVSDTDIDMVEHMRDNLVANHEEGSKDGVNSSLFPLTSKEQNSMAFTLKGREVRNGRDTYHILFGPKDKDDYGWKGDAWIDAAELEPLVIRTSLSHNLPLYVRAMLGTNLPGLGFTVVYAPQDGVWFPSSFGTEFKVKVLFFFERQIVINVRNRDFERTHVNTTVHTEAAAPPTQPASPDLP